MHNVEQCTIFMCVNIVACFDSAVLFVPFSLFEIVEADKTRPIILPSGIVPFTLLLIFFEKVEHTCRWAVEHREHMTQKYAYLLSSIQIIIFKGKGSGSIQKIFSTRHHIFLVSYFKISRLIIIKNNFYRGDFFLHCHLSLMRKWVLGEESRT